MGGGGGKNSFCPPTIFFGGGGQLDSRVVKFALSRCSLVIFVLHKVNIIQ